MAAKAAEHAAIEVVRERRIVDILAVCWFYCSGGEPGKEPRQAVRVYKSSDFGARTAPSGCLCCFIATKISEKKPPRALNFQYLTVILLFDRKPYS
ncbi:MAG: hypothetical protein K2Y39_06970 [Candidatus Obscuribacterales bacterium]|nr:hypothetical protein [Candidatus Obscuribacterales bacterium]